MKRKLLTLFLSFLFVSANAFAISQGNLQQIYSMASRGDVQGLRQMKASGFSLDLEDASGNTPYCTAVKSNNPVAVRTLELAGADINHWCMIGTNVVTQSMIYDAASDRDTKRLAYWKKHGIPMDITDPSSGDTALCKAVYKGDCVAIDTLIKSGANQYHACLQRIPESIRRSLSCREVVRDWSKVGYTLLGIGLVGGGVMALSGSGGGSTEPACGYGEHWDGEKCVHCEVDQYWTSSAGCVPCPTGTFSTGYEDKCTSCAPNEIWNNSECEACPEGQFSTGKTRYCSVCGLNQFWNGSECENCPSGSFSDGTTTQCTRCSSTQIWDGESCVDCPEGYHREGNSCVACPRDQYWDGNACRNCPEGQHGDGLSCESCPGGTFWNEVGRVCQTCPTPANYCVDPVPLEYYPGTQNRCPKYQLFTCSGEFPNCHPDTGACISCAGTPIEREGCNVDNVYDRAGCLIERNIDCSLTGQYCNETADSAKGVCVQCTKDEHCVQDGRQGTCNSNVCIYRCTDLSTGLDREPYKGEYIDSNGYCKPIAPPPASGIPAPPSTASGTEYSTAGFLAQINAIKAYERGYTGYKINRPNSGADVDFGLPATMSSEKMKVAIISTGLNTENADRTYVQEDKDFSDYTAGSGFVDNTSPSNIRKATYNNLDLNDNLSDNNFNFDYGLCKGGDKTNCYGILVRENDSGGIVDPDHRYLVFYGSDETYQYIHKDTGELIDPKDVGIGEDYSFASMIRAETGTSELTQLQEWFNSYDYQKNYDLTTGSALVKTDINPHYLIDGQQDPWGTALAGIVGAAKNNQGSLGVAYNAEIISAVADIVRPYFGGNETTDAVSVLKGAGANVILQSIVRTPQQNTPYWDYTAEWVRAIGNMANAFSTSEMKAFNTIANQKKDGTFSNQATALVVPTGDYAGNNTISADGVVSSSVIDDASAGAGAPLATDWSDSRNLDGLFVAVTAVKKTGDKYHLMENALPCGSAKGYCLAAPGKATTTTTPDASGEYETTEISGTKVAAATVAGSIALLQGAYQHLSTPEIVEILFKTATDLGVSGNDNLYGYGLINLDAATKPVGALWVHDSDDYLDRIGTAETTATLSAMATSAIQQLPTTMVAYDDYARPFPVSLSNMITVKKSETKDLRDEFNAFMAGRDKTIVTPNETFSMSYAPRYSDRSAHVPHGQMEMNMNVDDYRFNLFYTEDMMQSHGGSYFERVLNNPLVQIQEAYGVEMGYQLNPKFSVMGAFATGYNGFLGDGDEDYDAPENRVSSYQVGMAYRPKKSITFKTAYGVMNENESVLGMMGQGAFDVKGASTAFVSAGLTLRPADKLKLDLMYTYGWTKPERGDGIMQFSKLTSDGFALVAQYDLGDDNMLGFSLSSPLRVNSGQLSVNMPVGRDANRMYSKWYSADLKPTARELDFALFYKDQVTPDLFIQSELSLRLNPDHQADASPDYRGLFGLKYQY
ncbi:MAG: hypothetical protein E7021_04330 [Alphaproteobacteria bacterium]|nr:hypothetical protein [Alphaproteobacteria bacterium]